MNIQEQHCTNLTLSFSDKPTISPQTIRNRRYHKLIQLRKQGFFSQDQIKLRHPVLYHTYLGQHSQKSTSQNYSDCTLSQFLEKNLINLSYKEKLAQELGNQIEPERPSADNWQVLEEMTGEVTLGGQGMKAEPLRSWQIVEQQEIEMQQQNLIDHAQQLFLCGKVDPTFINYPQIDNKSQYDSIQGQNRELEQQYFNGQGSKVQDQKINRQYSTGIQDY